MGKKVWFDISIRNKYTGEIKVIARVRSEGLAAHAWVWFEGLYKHNREWELI